MNKVRITAIRQTVEFFRLDRVNEEFFDVFVSRPSTATLGNNLHIHALIWREYPRIGRPKDILKC